MKVKVMKAFFEKFARREDGAVTVDWVVLTAAVVGLGVMAALTIENGATGLSEDIWTYMDGLQLFD